MIIYLIIMLAIYAIIAGTIVWWRSINKMYDKAADKYIEEFKRGKDAN